MRERGINEEEGSRALMTAGGGGERGRKGGISVKVLE